MDDKRNKENKKLEIEKLKKEVEEYKNKYLRALADYQNLEKRTQLEKESMMKQAAQEVICDLLEVLDTLEKVVQHYPQDQGLKLTIENFHRILKKYQVEKIDVLGKKFDPVEMECVEIVESDKDDEVIDEIRAGYRLKDKVIRVARVKVGKKNKKL